MRTLRHIGRRLRESFEARGKHWYQVLKARFPGAPEKRAQRMIRIAQAIKLKRGCKRCGYKEAYEALDFDHRESITKKFAISHPFLDCTIAEFKHELSKCDVLCANCHRIITKQRLEEHNGPKLKAKINHLAKKKAKDFAAATWDEQAPDRFLRSPLMQGAAKAKEIRRQEYHRLRVLVVNKQAMSQDKKRYFELAREFGEDDGSNRGG